MLISYHLEQNYKCYNKQSTEPKEVEENYSYGIQKAQGSRGSDLTLRENLTG